MHSLSLFTRSLAVDNRFPCFGLFRLGLFSLVLRVPFELVPLFPCLILTQHRWDDWLYFSSIKKKGVARKSTYVESAFIDEEQGMSGCFDFFLFFWGPCKLGFGV